MGESLNGNLGARLGSIGGVAKPIFKLMQDNDSRIYCSVGTGKWPGGGERGFSRVGWMLPKSLAGGIENTCDKHAFAEPTQVSHREAMQNADTHSCVCQSMFSTHSDMFYL